MNKAPAFQFYAAEYLADENVQLLTLEQEGIYIRLLAYCWREGSIPSDPVKLSRLCKSAPVEALDGVVDLFVPGDEGRLTHGRLDVERRKHEEYRQKQAANGARGGRPVRDNPDESQTKGLGLSGETQMKAKKRSSSSFASSSSTSTSIKETLACTADAVPAGELIGTLPLLGEKNFFIFQNEIDEWQEAYPAADVQQECREMRQWLIANPANKKTAKGIRRFINAWLGRAQDRAPLVKIIKTPSQVPDALAAIRARNAAAEAQLGNQ